MAQRLTSALHNALASGCQAARNCAPTAGGLSASRRVLSAACCPEDTSNANGAQIIESRNIKELYSVGDLQAAIGDSKGNPLLLTIYSPSCRPCRDFLGRLDSLWDVFGQSVNLAKFSMRHQGMQVMSEHFKVEKVPTTLAVYQGSVLDVHVGSMDDASLTDLLSKISKNSQTTASELPAPQPRAHTHSQQYACNTTC